MKPTRFRSFRSQKRLQAISRLIHFNLYPRLRRSRRPVVLDLGVEQGEVGWLVRDHLHDAFLIGVDVWRAELQRPTHEGIYDVLYNEDALTFTHKLASKPDLVVASEVLEHMDPSRGLTLLHKLASLNVPVIATTPWGFKKQTSIDGNPHQRHRAGFMPDDFRNARFDLDRASAEAEDLIVVTRCL